MAAAKRFNKWFTSKQEASNKDPAETREEEWDEMKEREGAR